MKGKENKVVDALSHHTNLLYVTARSNYETDLEDKIGTSTILDKKYQKVKERTTKNKANIVKSKFSLNRKGLLTYKNILYVPES